MAGPARLGAAGPASRIGSELTDSGRVAYTAPLGLHASSTVATLSPRENLVVTAAAPAPSAVTQKRKPSSAAKSRPGRAAEGCAIVPPSGSPKAVGAAGQAPQRSQKMHKKTNNLAQEARMKAVLEAGLAPLQAELAAIRQRMDAQHEEVMRVLTGVAAAGAARDDSRPSSTGSSRAHRRVVRTTTHEELELSA